MLNRIRYNIKQNSKIYAVIAVTSITLAAILLVYLLKQPISNYAFSVSEAIPDAGRMEDDGYYFDMPHGEEIEEGQKVFFNIPMEVKKGSYTLRVGYRSTSTASSISVTSKDNPWSVKCDYVSLTHKPEELPGEFNMNYGLGYLPGFVNSEMYITRDVNDLDIFVVYSGYQDFHIESVELIGNRTFIKTIFLTFVILLAIVDILVICFINRKEWKIEGLLCEVGIISAIALLASIPLLFKMGLSFDDGDFLYGRFNGIADGLRDGQFPVRIHPNTLKGFGYGVSYFYPELLLYPFGILKLIGYSLRFVYYAMILCMNFATAGISYFSVKRVFANHKSACRAGINPGNKHVYWTGVFASFIYIFCFYRLLDIYSRGAVAEALAIMFLPLIVTGLYVILAEDGSIAILTAGLLGLVNSHILSCELVAVFAIFVCVVCFKKVVKRNIFFKLAKSCLITLLLSVYFIIPFLHMSTTDKFKVYAENAYDTSMNMLSFPKIFAMNFINPAGEKINPFIYSRFTLGIVIMIGTIVLFTAAMICESKQNSSLGQVESKFTKICFIFGMIAIIITSSLFPWKSIENIGGVLQTVFCMVQFPWRYLSIALVCFVFAMAGSIEIIGTNKRILYVVELLICGLVFVQAINLFSSLSRTANDSQLIFDGSALAKYNMVGMGEYEPVSFDNSDNDLSIEELQYKYNENASINPTGDQANDGLTIGPLSKVGTKSTILIINPTGEEQILYMPIVFYDGYRVSNVSESADGVERVPELLETEHGTVGIKVPADYYNGAHIEYKENVTYRIAEFVSLISLLIIVMGSVWEHTRRLLEL